MPTKPIIIVPSGGTAGQTTGGKKSTGSIFVTPGKIVQVIGMVPLVDCAYSDCRNQPQDGCYFNPVFGNVVNGLAVTGPTYENDFSTFLIDYPVPANNQFGSYYSINWVLQRADNQFFLPGSDSLWEWEDIASLNNNTFGYFYAPGSITSQPTYNGYALNWGLVQQYLGPGIYRVGVQVLINTPKIIIVRGVPISYVQQTIVQCAYSEPFLLRAWDCVLAEGTVKFESSITGNVGSIDEYYKLFDLCGIKWYDSIRMRGFFGFEKSKYDELINEWQSGQLEEVRDKTINRFTFDSYYLPKWVHDRFKAYALMADTLLVSDYNINNSDYFIKQKGVRKAAGYEPVYLDTKNFDGGSRYLQRRSKVSVEFREAVESVIKNNCCVPKC